MKKRFSDEQIISILRKAEAGVSARELCRKHAISDATFYTWRKKFGGMEVPEVKRLKSLEEENARLKKLLAEAMLDKEALQVALGRKYCRHTTSGKPLSLCVIRPVCRNVVPAGLLVCLCRPAATRLSVRRLMRIYKGASLNWHWSAGVLATSASGSCCVGRAFMSITSGYTVFTTLMD